MGCQWFTFHSLLESNVSNIKKLQQSRNKSGMAQRVPGSLGSQISWHSAHEFGEVVSLTHRSTLPRGISLVLIFTSGWVDPRAMVRSEGNMSLKNPVTALGIDPGTDRLVAQRLNHYATPGPLTLVIHYYIWNYEIKTMNVENRIIVNIIQLHVIYS
jgi:hypothetical protein